MPLEVVWSALARRRLQEIRDYVALDKPQAAARLATRLVAITELLPANPHLGRPGAHSGVRELVVPDTPYILIYRLQKRRIVISTIVHGAQRRRR
ncbi:MAG TPA: type II toxin-antitoxin system RelE/ParE family toxin [Terriglobales bacterium]|nr:type II toxin-antitoxin system RelE/ParE family toxin [Terriglobales bacterium]